MRRKTAISINQEGDFMFPVQRTVQSGAKGTAAALLTQSPPPPPSSGEK